MKQSFDVIVIGGGPSGSCAAIRLLELGYKVALIEKEKFPRSSIGESLSPGVKDIFSFLGVKDLLTRHEYLHDLPAKVIWDSKTPVFIPGSQRGPGVIVDRSRMDKDLLDQAVQRGLTLFQPARVKGINENIVSFIHKGEETRAEAKQFINAAGRAGILAADRLLAGPSSIAVWGHLADFPNKENLVEAMPQGWLWGSPLPDKTFRVMFYCNPEELKGRTAKELLVRQISNSALFSKVDLQGFKGKIRTCPVMPCVNKRPWEQNVISVGDAAFSMDPLSSTGVEKAMRLSLQAAVAVNTLLKNSSSDLAKTFYYERLAESFKMHARWSAEYYSQAWPSKTNAFWKARIQSFELQSDGSESEDHFLQYLQVESEPEKFDAEISVAQTAKQLWNKKLRLAAECRFRKTGCVVDDRIQMNYALEHPSLSRTVAFLGQTYLYPLMQKINGAKTFGELVNDWAVLCPHKHSARILTWLWSRKIIQSL